MRNLLLSAKAFRMFEHYVHCHAYSIGISLQDKQRFIASSLTLAMPLAPYILPPHQLCAGLPKNREMLLYGTQNERAACAHLPLRAVRPLLPMMSIMPGLPKPAVSQLDCIGSLAWCRRSHSLSKPGRPIGSRLCSMWLTCARLCRPYMWLVTVCPC